MISEREMLPFMRVLLPLAALPDKALVTKRNGEKFYTVSREIRIYTGEKGKPPQRVVPEKGVVFLIPTTGGDAVSATADSIIHEWHVSEEELLIWLNDRQMEAEAK